MKFFLRDLLLVTVIVALAVGWGVDRSRLSGVIEEQDSKFMHLVFRLGNPRGPRERRINLPDMPDSLVPAPIPPMP